MTVRFHKGDISSLTPYAGHSIAIDTETLGLNPLRDRLCVVQLSPGDGSADIVQIIRGKRPELLLKLLTDPTKTKILHFARFDLAAIYNAFGVMMAHMFSGDIAVLEKRDEDARINFMQGLDIEVPP